MPPILRIRDETGKVIDIPAIVGPPGKDGMSNLGENITEGSTNDTVAFWAEKGSGQAWFSSKGMLVNQPSQYGFVISYTNGADAFQMFSDQTNGVTYFRYGDNINNWFKHWTALELPGMATGTELGLVMVDGNNGIGVNTENGNLFIKQASNSEIDGKEHSYKSITPENLDYAVKAALTNNANELSDTERASALGWLGAAATDHTHTGYANATHTHSAADIKAGTLTGIVGAMSNIAYTTAQVRSIILSTADPAGGSNGQVWLKYK